MVTFPVLPHTGFNYDPPSFLWMFSWLLKDLISDFIYISQLIRFARVSSHVVDFNARNKSLTAKLLQQQQGYRYHKLRKTFSKFYRRHYELVSKFNVGLKTLLHQGLSEPEFYGDLVYKFKKIVGRANFSDQFRKIIVRYKRIGYNINIMQQSACLVFNPITVNNFASLFNCTPVGRASDSIVTKWIKSCLLQCFGTFKMPILMFISVLVFRPEGQIWNPVRRDTRIYVRRILNASRISKTQLNSCTISPS